MPDIEHIQVGNVLYDIKDPSKAPLDSPELTGTPSAPTPETEIDNGQLATTEFVHNVVEEMNIDIQAQLAGKSDADHDHAGTYYTQAELDEALAGKMDSLRRTVTGSFIEIEDSLAGRASSVSAEFDYEQNNTEFNKAWSEGFRKNKLPIRVSNVLSLNPQYEFEKYNNFYTAPALNNSTGNFLVYFYKDNEALKSIGQSSFAALGEEDQNIILYDGGPFDLDPQATYILSGAPAGSVNKASLKIIADDLEIASDTGYGASFSGSVITEAEHIVVKIVYTDVLSGGFFQPMIRLSTESNSTYEPYAYVNDIPYADALNITRIGKNLFDPSVFLEENTNIILANDEIIGKASDFINLGGIRIKGSPSEKVTFSITGYTENESGADSGQLTLMMEYSGGVFYLSFNLNDTSPVSKVTPSIGMGPSDSYVLSFNFPGGINALEEHDDTWHFKFIQLEVGTEQTDYEPYNEDRVAIPFSQATGKVVSGTVNVSARKITSGKKFLDGYDLNIFGIENVYERTIVTMYDGNNNSYQSSYDTLVPDLVKVVVKSYGSLQSALPAGTANTLISNRFSRSYEKHEAGYCELSTLNGVNTLTFVIPKSQLESEEVDGIEKWLQDHPTQFVYTLTNDEITYGLSEKSFSLLEGYNIVYSNAEELSFKYPYSSSFDAETLLESYAPKSSPALTGTPTAPTASADNNSTQIATTAYVKSQKNDVVYMTTPVTTIGWTNGRSIFMSNSLGKYSSIHIGGAYSIRYPILYLEHSNSQNAVINDMIIEGLVPRVKTISGYHALNNTIYDSSLSSSLYDSLNDGDMLYIRGTLSGTSFTIDMVLTNDTSVEEKYYLELGPVKKNESRIETQIFLLPEHKIFQNIDGTLQLVGSSGGGSVSEWGDLTGDIEDQEDLQNALDEKAKIVITEKSGSVVSIKDAAAYPVEELKVSIEPLHDLHGYDSPWPAGGGANLFDEQWEVGGINGNTGANINNDTDKLRSKNNIPVNAETDYCFVRPSYITRLYYYWYQSDDTYISNGSITTTNGVVTSPALAGYVRLCFVGTSYTDGVAVNYPSSVTTYSPYSNICPITGHTGVTVTRMGKNLFDKTAVTEGKRINASGEIASNANCCITDFIPIIAGEAYTLTEGSTSHAANERNCLYDENKNFISAVSTYSGSPITFTTPNNARYIRLTLFTADINTAQLELGSTASAYSAYQGTTITIPFGQTVYGGTLDVKTGEMTVDRVTHMLNGTESFSITDQGGTGQRFSKQVSNLGWEAVKSGAAKETSSHFLKAASGQGNTSPFGRFYISTYLIFSDNGHVFADAASFNTWLATQYANGTPVQVSYDIATPVTVTLDPATLSTLLGENVLWANTGDIYVKYKADTKMYIDNSQAEASDTYTKTETDTKLSAKADKNNAALTGNPTAPTQTAGNNSTRIATTAFVQTAVGSKAEKSILTYTESSMTATRNYVIGDLIIVGSNLYKATANISNGGTLTVNTNVVATTFAAENALKANAADVYTKTESDTLLAGKSDTSHTHDDKADIIYDEASGDIASFSDGAPYPVESLTVGIDPVQDLHGQDAPYPAGGGKNLFDPRNVNSANGITTTVNSDGSITISGKPTANNVYCITDQDITDLLEDGATYTFSQTEYPNPYYHCPQIIGIKQDDSKTYYQIHSQERTFTVDKTTYKEYHSYVITVSKASWGDVERTITFKLQLEKSASATAWASYWNICPITGHTSATVTRTGKAVGVWNYTIPSGGDHYSVNIGTNTYPEARQAMIDMVNNLKPGTYKYGILGNNLGASNTRSIIIKYTDGTDVNFVYRGSGMSDWYISPIYVTIPEGLKDKTVQYIYAYFGKNDNVTPSDATIGPLVLTLPDDTPELTDIYQGVSVSVSFGQTVYGGKLNLMTGVLTVTHQVVDMGDLSWAKSSSNPSVFTLSLSNHALTKKINILCSMYKAVNAEDYSLSTMPDKSIKTNQSYADYLYVKDTTYADSTADVFTDAVDGQTVVYELATPVSVTLSPQQINTLLGDNVIWSDTGAVSVSYRADTKRYVNKEISKAKQAIKDIIAGSETSMVATKNYTTGKFVIVGDDLYKLTANVNNGASFVVGTNVQKTTLADIILALAS